MDAADAMAAGRGRGRHRGRGDAPGAAGTGDGRRGWRSGPGIFGAAALSKAIARGVASGEVTISNGPPGGGPGQRMDGVSKGPAASRLRNRPKNLDQLSVVGLKRSKAAANTDGGVTDLLAFLERKATGNDPTGPEPVRIRKVCLRHRPRRFRRSSRSSAAVISAHLLSGFRSPVLLAFV